MLGPLLLKEDDQMTVAQLTVNALTLGVLGALLIAVLAFLPSMPSVLQPVRVRRENARRRTRR